MESEESSESTAKDVSKDVSLDLLAAKTIQEWADMHSPCLSDIFQVMEYYEDWVIDDISPSFLLTSEKISQAIAQSPMGILIKTPEDKKRFIYGVAYLSASRSIRLLSLADEKQPGLIGDIIQISRHEIENDKQLKEECNVLIARLNQIIRIEAYRRIFAPDRREAVLTYIQNIQLDTNTN